MPKGNNPNPQTQPPIEAAQAAAAAAVAEEPQHPAGAAQAAVAATAEPEPKPKPEKPKNNLVYGNITLDIYQQLETNMQSRLQTLENLKTAAENTKILEAKKAEGFFAGTPTKDYTKDRKTILTDLIQYHDLAGTIPNRITSLKLEDLLRISSENKSVSLPTLPYLSICCYYLSRQFGLCYWIVQLENRYLDLRYQLYRSHKIITPDLPNRETVIKELNADIKKAQDLIKLGKKQYKNLVKSYQSFAELNDQKKTETKELEPGDKKLKDNTQEYQTFENSCKEILNSKPQPPVAEPSTPPVSPASAPNPESNPPDLKNKETPKNKAAKKAELGDDNTAALWDAKLGPLYNQIEQMHKEFTEHFDSYNADMSPDQKNFVTTAIDSLQQLMRDMEKYKTQPLPVELNWEQVANNFRQNFDSLLISQDFQKANKVIALFKADTGNLMGAINNIKDDPKKAYEYLQSKVQIQNLLMPLDVDYLHDFKLQLSGKLNEMKRYARFLAPGSDFKRPTQFVAKPVSEMFVQGNEQFETVINPLNDAILALNNAVKTEKESLKHRKIHDEEYKNKINDVKSKKQEEKIERLSIVNSWISKYFVRLRHYVIKDNQGKWNFIPSSYAALPKEAAKKELCNALYDAKVSLKGLDPRKPAEINQMWKSLTEISQIKKKLKDLEKDETEKGKNDQSSKGRTEKIIYTLYAILHCIKEPTVLSSKEEQELKKLAKEAGSFGMRLSGATIYKAKSQFQNLIKFLIQFLKYPTYCEPPKSGYDFSKNPLTRVRKDITKYLKDHPNPQMQKSE